MKKTITLFFAVALIFAIASCKSAPQEIPAPQEDNPGVGPSVTVTIPELFSPDPDIVNDTMTIDIAVEHPVPIRNWSITVQPNRRPAVQAEAAPAEERQGTGRRSRQGTERRVFFEQTGRGNPPTEWQWDGRGNSGDMVMSATDYRFTLSVNDVYNNNTEYEGIIAVDIIVRREGDNLRIIVPSIIFPPNASSFDLLSEEDLRSNTRILSQIARSLNRFQDYRIVVEGHSNPTTAPNTAQRRNEDAILKRLSEERANAVINHLVVNNNIARERLSAVGIGGDRTVVAYNDTEETWQNRRVEFLLIR